MLVVADVREHTDAGHGAKGVVGEREWLGVQLAARQLGVQALRHAQRQGLGTDVDLDEGGAVILPSVLCLCRKSLSKPAMAVQNGSSALVYVDPDNRWEAIGRQRRAAEAGAAATVEHRSCAWNCAA